MGIPRATVLMRLGPLGAGMSGVRLVPPVPGINDGMPTRKDMPGTLKRSPKKAQDTYEMAHDSAVML